MMKINIIQPKIEGSGDVLFYDSGTVATITKPNGTKLYLEVAGDVGFSIGDDRYRNDQRFEFINDRKLNDAKLSKLLKADKIKWNMNNWFEVLWEKKGDSSLDCALGDVAYDYDSAIELLEYYAKDKDI
jgi:hypothetical protein